MQSGQWEIAGYDRPTAVGLYRQGFNALVAVVLAARGIRSREECDGLYRTGVTLSDPMTLTDMAPAVERIRRAAAAGEKIAVYGDYDVDGMTASTLLWDYLKSRGCDVVTYIPERLTEGYGLGRCALEKLRREGTGLVITVDCGVTAVEEAEYAASLGLDLIITDHHQPGDVLPRAAAVIDPKRESGDHPCFNMAGVGVAFKLAEALEGPEGAPELLRRYGDLAALGTVADVMPVLGENRLLIRSGLEQMQSDPRPGVRALIRAAGVNPARLDAGALGFTLAPRLNAAGRLGETGTAVRLLRTDSEEEADALAEQLCELNRRRQSIESQVLEEALALLPAAPDGPVVVAGRDWHQGVAGIVASKLSEICRYPAVVICVKDGIGHGSCRASGSFSLVGALAEAGDLLESFGGHHLAAGLTIREENIDKLRQSLRESFLKQGAGLYTPTLAVDFEMTRTGLLTLENVEGLSLLAPFGNGNPQPVLMMRGAAVDMITPLRGGKATKLWLRWQGDCHEAIAFGRSVPTDGIREGDVLDLVFTPGVNEYRGRRSVQLVLKDLRQA